MPYNRPGKLYYTTATKAVVHGEACIENGVSGVAVKQKAPPFGTGPATNVLLNTVSIGEDFGIIDKGIVQVAAVSTPAKGDAIYITASSNALTKTASGNVKYGVVVEIAGQRGTPTGRMRVDLDLKATL